MVGRWKLWFVNFGLRIILTFLKIQNGDPANTSQNWHVGSAKFAICWAIIEPLHYVPILPHIPSKFGHSLSMKFLFLEWAIIGQPSDKKKFTSLLWIKDFMMNFLKSVRKSGKRTSCFHGFSWQLCKQYKCNMDKKFFSETFRCICIHCQNFISVEVVVQEFGGGWFSRAGEG